MTGIESQIEVNTVQRYNYALGTGALQGLAWKATNCFFGPRFHHFHASALQSTITAIF